MARAEADFARLDESNPLLRAHVSAEVGDLVAARQFLEIAKDRLATYVAESPNTVQVLLKLKAFDEAEAFTLAGSKRFPHQPHFLEGYAMAAEGKHDRDQAIRRWAVVRAKFPHSQKGYVHALWLLKDLGRLDEAEQLLKVALRWLPQDVFVLAEHASLAELRGNWEEAYKRWEKLFDSFPRSFVGAARVLHKLDRTAAAEAIIATGRIRYPLEVEIPIENARLAEEKGDKVEALKRWSFVRQRFPLDPKGYWGELRLLSERKDWINADAIAREAVDHFPTEKWPMVEYATLAHARQEWLKAADRWAALREKFPDFADGFLRGAEALLAADRKEEAKIVRETWQPKA